LRNLEKRLFALCEKIPGKKMSDEQRAAWKPMVYAMWYLGALYTIGGIFEIIYTQAW